MVKKATLQSLSALTGYSASTISRVLSGKAEQYRIAQKTVESIMAAAKKYSYTPDPLAQSLKTKESKTIGLIVPILDNPFFGSLSSMITATLKEYGYNVLLGYSGENTETEKEIIQSFIRNRVAGIIVASESNDPAVLEEADSHIPIVLVDRYFPESRLRYICTDNYTGGAQAARHLLDKGYRNTLVIQGTPTAMPSIDRYKGFREALLIYGNKASCTLAGTEFTAQSGYNATMEAFKGKARNKRPDSIFCLNINIALGAFKALHELGLRIPEDVAFITFDNSPFLEYMNPPITRIAHPINQISQLCCDVMLGKLRKDNGGFQKDESSMETDIQLLVRPYLIEGKSCR